MEKNALDVLRSGAIAVGEYSNEFINKFGALVENPNVVPTSDMSYAMQIALRLSGVSENDDVLTTPFACMATNAPIAAIGAKPAWVDVDPITGMMDPDSLIKSITPKTKALILYHLAGYPAQVEDIARICFQKGIPLIEDCNNALLAQVGKQQVGSWGRHSIYSFYPNRQINASEGGALVTLSPEDSRRALKLRRYGVDSANFRLANGEINPESDINEIGWAATFNNLCSSIGVAQILDVKNRVERTRTNAKFLDGVCAGLTCVTPVPARKEDSSSYWVYLIRSKYSRELMQFLDNKGIKSSKVHYPNHFYTGFGVEVPDLMGCDQFFKDVLALPCGWWLEEGDLQYIASSLEDFEVSKCH
ncbi:pyridoxal-phosphate-dependent/plp-dependent aminotransferase [Polynucleobacter paneuropaeus]|nr:pyridoxal-phosphate-dependent/plp-dependent aminotransferase [Polynucleobacter paneuropaeus]